MKENNSNFIHKSVQRGMIPFYRMCVYVCVCLCETYVKHIYVLRMVCVCAETYMLIHVESFNEWVGGVKQEAHITMNSK